MVVVLNASTLEVPLRSSVPGPDLVKLVAVRLPESVDGPVWPSRT